MLTQKIASDSVDLCYIERLDLPMARTDTLKSAEADDAQGSLL